ncbi:metallopeptidase family protein [Dietzia sp. SLG310A2-38A2]|uniref:metallopeptidase family protein n=1 Tax=Dietzia sp. SLG310A2-38A2 TaxID=1630643 RepID=UPI0015FE2883|nr:metallopeptidase family protein [Dietzia sp. SLG310A2-38A2]
MSIVVTESRFESLVDDALDSVPDALFTAMDNVVVLIADRHPEEPGLLGLYEGVALTERDTTYSGFLPDTITIFRGALCDFCSTEEQLVHEVAVTVIHEIAHHFGIEEHTLHALGWG